MACAKFLEEKVIDSYIQVVLAKTVDSDLKSNLHGFHARFCLYNMSRLMVKEVEVSVDDHIGDPENYLFAIEMEES